MGAPPSDDLDRRLELAIDLARQAGALTQRYFRSPDLAVEQKSDASPVTAADREAEALLRAGIQQAFPDDGILGEEEGETPGQSDFRWVLDPIDGTKSFVHGVGLYTNLIGVQHGEQAVLGVIHAPAAEELVYARHGGGAWYEYGDNPARQVQVSSQQRLDQSLILYTDAADFSRVREDARDNLWRLLAGARLGRSWGDAYGYLLVAVGRAEAMIDPALNVWDAAPLQPILEEAGGRFTDWQGRATISGQDGVGSNGWLHELLLERLNGDG